MVFSYTHTEHLNEPLLHNDFTSARSNEDR